MAKNIRKGGQQWEPKAERMLKSPSKTKGKRNRKG
jgi:hypothetical protein